MPANADFPASGPRKARKYNILTFLPVILFLRGEAKGFPSRLVSACQSLQSPFLVSMSPVSRSFSTVFRIIKCFLPISLEVIQKTFTICEWFPCLIFVRIMAGVPAMPACGMGHLSVYPTRFWASLPLDERLPGKVKESLFRRGVYHTLCS